MHTAQVHSLNKHPDYQPHEAAEIFPAMGQDDMEALAKDIDEHGLRDPIILHEGKILDGRHRYQACLIAGVIPRFEEWDGDGTAVAFVISKNLHRRHLTESQRAMVGAKLATLKVGHVASQRDGARIHSPGLSAQEAADLLHVGRQSVTDAKKVLSEGTPAEVSAVERGEMAVSTIADQIRSGESPKQRQRRRDESLSQTGRNPERIQRQQINAEIWGRVRDSLIHLTSLPKPSDVVSIAYAHDKTGLIDARVPQALQWLKDFADECRNRNKA